MPGGRWTRTEPPGSAQRAELRRPAAAAQRRRPAQAQALLHDRPLRDDDSPRRQVVVVEAGVVTGHPTDEPDLDLVVQAQALEDALGGVVADEMAPALGVGGEWGGSVLMSMEWGSQKRKGFLGSWPQFGVPVGLLLSTAITALTVTLAGSATFGAWAWRIPFLLSIVLVGVGLYIRLGIMETPVFSSIVQQNRIEARPITQAIRRNWREIILSALLRMSEQAPFYIFTAFVLAYGTEDLGFSKGFLTNAVMVAAALSNSMRLRMVGFRSEISPRCCASSASRGDSQRSEIIS